MNSLPSTADAVDIDHPFRRVRVRAEANRIHSSRNIMARAPDLFLDCGDTATETQNHMVKFP